ncbi:uncharacterized protein UV8b_04543 [Ustilaginoidea virens]|uniref:Uncharacterized protein n=1 Tax=Ustilaginoidea virens TaxID=1159556 RepID=A0A8E5MI84_USTVR|nr:uncharacterized protein UV8b_04543 [Ustilaginoidea virens]QUC20302.1 hypothetical protein UV8b_04543 [Ustilaginoidea virens]
MALTATNLIPIRCLPVLFGSVNIHARALPSYLAVLRLLRIYNAQSSAESAESRYVMEWTRRHEQGLPGDHQNQGGWGARTRYVPSSYKASTSQAITAGWLMSGPLVKKRALESNSRPQASGGWVSGFQAPMAENGRPLTRRLPRLQAALHCTALHCTARQPAPTKPTQQPLARRARQKTAMPGKRPPCQNPPPSNDKQFCSREESKSPKGFVGQADTDRACLHCMSTMTRRQDTVSSPHISSLLPFPPDARCRLPSVPPPQGNKQG